MLQLWFFPAWFLPFAVIPEYERGLARVRISGIHGVVSREANGFRIYERKCPFSFVFRNDGIKGKYHAMKNGNWSINIILQLWFLFGVQGFPAGGGWTGKETLHSKPISNFHTKKNQNWIVIWTEENKLFDRITGWSGFLLSGLSCYPVKFHTSPNLRIKD